MAFDISLRNGSSFGISLYDGVAPPVSNATGVATGVATNAAVLRGRGRLAGTISTGSGLSGLTSLWKFDESSGTVYDEIGTNDSVAVGSNVLYNQTGRLGGAIEFRGTINDFVQLPDDISLQFEGEDVSFGAWFYTGSSGQMGIFGGETGGFAVDTDAGLTLFLGNTNVQAYTFATPTWNLNQWNFFAIVFDSHSSTNNVRLYLNGSSSVRTADFNGTAGASMNCIGCDTMSGAQAQIPFTGLIDQPFIAKGKLLSIAELDYLYNSGNGVAYPFGGGARVIGDLGTHTGGAISGRTDGVATVSGILDEVAAVGSISGRTDGIGSNAAILHGHGKLYGTVASEPLVIADHSAVADFDNIPQAYIDEVKKMWVSMAGESHSGSYRYGAQLIEDADADYAVSIVDSGTPEAYTASNLRLSRATWGDVNNASGWIYDYGEEDFWTNPTAIARTKAFLLYCKNNGPALAAFGFGWCWDCTWINAVGGTMDPVFYTRWAGATEGGADGNLRWGLDAGDETLTGNSVSLQNYLDAVEEYIDYCKTNAISTKIIWTTGPVDNDANMALGESGYQQYLKYQAIRSHVNSLGRGYFLDFADILSYSDALVQNTTTWTDGNSVLRTFPIIAADNLVTWDNRYHFGSAGAIKVAKGLWWILAKMAGWNLPSSTSVSGNLRAQSSNALQAVIYAGSNTNAGVIHGHGRLYGASNGVGSNAGVLQGHGRLYGATNGVGSNAGLLHGHGKLYGTINGVGSIIAIIKGRVSIKGFIGVFEQTPDIVVTIGTTGTYPSLYEAFMAINEGNLQGRVVLQVIENLLESQTSILYEKGHNGTSLYTSVLLYPTVPNLTITYPFGGTEAQIQFDGASDVVIDGRLNRTGVDSLTIGRDDIYGKAIELINSPTNIKVYNTALLSILPSDVTSENARSIQGVLHGNGRLYGVVNSGINTNSGILNGHGRLYGTANSGLNTNVSGILGRAFYVAVDGDDSDNGSFATPWATWQKGVNEALPGDTIYVRGGVYYITGNDNFVRVDPDAWGGAIGASGTAERPIRFFAYPSDFLSGNIPILDCHNAYETYETNFSCFGLNMVEYWHLKGLRVRNAYQRGVASRRPQGFGATNSVNLTFEKCTAQNIEARGFYFESGFWNTWDAEYADPLNPVYSTWSNDITRFIDCDAFDICDGINNSSGDGFKCGNYYGGEMHFIRCRAWYYSDDGFDPSGAGRRVFDSCWAVPTNKYESIRAEGNGFKTSGIGADQVGHVPTGYEWVKVTNCIAADCFGIGFYNNLEAIYGDGDIQNNAKYYNNLAYQCFSGFGDSYHYGITRTTVLRNNISYDNNDTTYEQVQIYTPAALLESNNTWRADTSGWPNWEDNPNNEVTDADFVSLDISQLIQPRRPDGTLPSVSFGHLRTGSDLIAAGIRIQNSLDGVTLLTDGEGLLYSVPPSMGVFEFDPDRIWGITNGISSVAGTIHSATANSGTSNGISSLQGILIGKGKLYSILQGIATISGNLRSKGTLNAISNSITTIVGILRGKGRLQSTLSNVTSILGQLIGRGRLSSSSVGVSNNTGILIGIGKLSNIINGTSTSSGTLLAKGKLLGVITGVGSSTGYLRDQGDTALLGFIQGIATISGVLNGKGKLHGTSFVRTINAGCLYNFYAVADGRNLAPTGWHVPSNAEWSTFVSYIGGVLSAYKIKEVGTSHWTYNPGATDEYGFKAQGVGLRYYDGVRGIFDYKKSFTFFLTSTQYNSSDACCYYLETSDRIYPFTESKKTGQSIRLVRDSEAGWIPGSKLIDQDGNSYDTVKIGNQIWTVQNLATLHFRNGDEISEVRDNTAWGSLTTPAVCSYQNNWNEAFSSHSFPSATLKAKGKLSGVISNTSVISGNLLAKGRLSGDINGITSNLGDLNGKGKLNSIINTNTSVDALLRLVGFIEGESVGYGSLEGIIEGWGSLKGVSNNITRVAGIVRKPPISVSEGIGNNLSHNKKTSYRIGNSDKKVVVIPNKNPYYRILKN